MTKTKRTIQRALTLLLICLSSNITLIAQPKEIFPKGKVVVISHRGDWRNAPENSLQAIENCIDMGVDMVEIDIQRTKDNELVVIHDGTIDRTTNGKGAVKDYTLEQLKEFRLLNGLQMSTNHTIPTLKEAMEVAKGRIWINIDKGYDHFDQVLQILEQTQTLDQVLIKSGHEFSKVSAENPLVLERLVYMPVFNANRADAFTYVESYLSGMKPVAFEVCFSEYTPQVRQIMDLILASGARVWVNTLWDSLCAGMTDDRAIEGGEADQTYGELFRWGVSMIQSDRPRDLIDYLKEQGLNIEKP